MLNKLEMWRSILTVLIIVVKVTPRESTAVADVDYRSASIKTKNNVKMVGDSLRKIQVNDLIECARCLAAKSCHAINYNTVTRDCYVSNSAASDNHKDLIYAVQYVYGELLSTKEKPPSGIHPNSCSDLKRKSPLILSGQYVIDPDGQSGKAPFMVYCDMTDKGGVGVTVVSHDSEFRTLVDGYGPAGSYIRSINYSVPISQLAKLTNISAKCEQFIKFECNNDIQFLEGSGWWVSREGKRENYWGGATPGSRKCACGMTNTCQNKAKGCNCYNGGKGWRSDSGFLTEKSKLPVIQLRFGDTDEADEQSYHTLGKLRCYGNI